MSSSFAAAALHARLYRYWEAKRGPRHMPSRADIDPAEIPDLLPNLALLEVIETGFRYRLVGTRVAQDLGRDTTGAAVGSYAKGMSFGATIVDMFDHARQRAMPQFTTGVYRLPDGPIHWVSRLLLPLGADGMKVDMLLMCRVATYPRGPAGGRDWLTGASGRKMETAEVTSIDQLEALCQSWAADAGDGATP